MKICKYLKDQQPSEKDIVQPEDISNARTEKCSENIGVVPARISRQRSSHGWRSPLPRASALIQRDFGCVFGVQQTKQLPHVAKVDLVWQLGV
ncbi:hypothetical protein TNCV_1022891 [Trichonephila clavipes]|nr:hypothetical protein TNCV_1022891 [Trichonephila clavipes]